MPRLISFAWTTAALIAEVKTCTRRDWSDEYALKLRVGEELTAYDHLPRAHGRPVARIRLTEHPVKESTADAPPEDWEREGFAYLEEHGYSVNGVTPRELWESWHTHPQPLWVIRFDPIALIEPIWTPEDARGR